MYYYLFCIFCLIYICQINSQLTPQQKLLAYYPFDDLQLATSVAEYVRINDRAEYAREASGTNSSPLDLGYYYFSGSGYDWILPYGISNLRLPVFRIALSDAAYSRLITSAQSFTLEVIAYHHPDARGVLWFSQNFPPLRMSGTELGGCIHNSPQVRIRLVIHVITSFMTIMVHRVSDSVLLCKAQYVDHDMKPSTCIPSSKTTAIYGFDAGSLVNVNIFRIALYVDLTDSELVNVNLLPAPRIRHTLSNADERISLQPFVTEYRMSIADKVNHPTESKDKYTVNVLGFSNKIGYTSYFNSKLGRRVNLTRNGVLDGTDITLIDFRFQATVNENTSSILTDTVVVYNIVMLSDITYASIHTGSLVITILPYNPLLRVINIIEDDRTNQYTLKLSDFPGFVQTGYVDYHLIRKPTNLIVFNRNFIMQDLSVINNTLNNVITVTNKPYKSGKELDYFIIGINNYNPDGGNDVANIRHFVPFIVNVVHRNHPPILPPSRVVECVYETDAYFELVGYDYDPGDAVNKFIITFMTIGLSIRIRSASSVTIRYFPASFDVNAITDTQQNSDGNGTITVLPIIARLDSFKIPTPGVKNYFNATIQYAVTDKDGNTLSTNQSSITIMMMNHLRAGSTSPDSMIHTITKPTDLNKNITMVATDTIFPEAVTSIVITSLPTVGMLIADSIVIQFVPFKLQPGSYVVYNTTTFSTYNTSFTYAAESSAVSTRSESVTQTIVVTLETIREDGRVYNAPSLSTEDDTIDVPYSRSNVYNISVLLNDTDSDNSTYLITISASNGIEFNLTNITSLDDVVVIIGLGYDINLAILHASKTSAIKILQDIYFMCAFTSNNNKLEIKVIDEYDAEQNMTTPVSATASLIVTVNCLASNDSNVIIPDRYITTDLNDACSSVFFFKCGIILPVIIIPGVALIAIIMFYQKYFIKNI